MLAVLRGHVRGISGARGRDRWHNSATLVIPTNAMPVIAREREAEYGNAAAIRRH